MKAEQIDVCVVTTIHGDYDARIYDRGVRVLTEGGLRVGFVGPWAYNDKSGVQPGDWRTTYRTHRIWQRPLLGFRTLITALRMRARVYHFHDLDFLPWAILLNAFSSGAVVYDVHENYPEDIRDSKAYIPKMLRKVLSHTVRALEHFAAARFRATIVVVPNLEHRFGKVAQRTVMVRNYSRLEARPDLAHAPNLLYSGGITRAYGSKTFLEIGRELKRRGTPARLVMVDKFAERDLRPGFLETIATEELPIDIIPLVQASQLHTIMTRGAVGLVADEPTPTAHLGVHAKFFDYMAMGLPIVASDIQNARVLLTGADCGILVPPSDAKAFVDAALGLMANKSELERLRANGMAAFSRLYSWRNEAEKLVTLMRELGTEKRAIAAVPASAH